MNQQEIENRKREIKNRMNEIERSIMPTAKRQAVFAAIGMIAGGVWAWKTKQKTLLKIGAVIGGGLCANLVSNLLISNGKVSEVTEYQQLQQELLTLEKIKN